MERSTEHQETINVPVDLLGNRCRTLGNLLLAERAPCYVLILHGMLEFRRRHELEPLHDDLYEDVRASIETLSGAVFTPEAFNQDIRQLQLWNLITCRIEQERLRGYRDNRRRKFRYRLADEATAFLLWLEDRRRDDLQPDEPDTRDVLEELSGTLRETARLMNRPGGVDDLDTARAIMYRLSRMSELTYEASRSLGELNVRLLGFVLGRYDIETARAIVNELDHFLKRFLIRIHVLRQEIVPELSKLRQPRYHARWRNCVERMESERRATSHLLRAGGRQDPDDELATLTRFYAADGALEKLCLRVSASALLVWRKLYAHLRELERRSHRLEDLRMRVGEMAQYPPNDTRAAAFIQALLAPARLIGDMHYWSDTEKADPPEPRWEKHRVRVQASEFLTTKQAASGQPTQSIEDQRLRRLRDWMQRAGLAPESEQAVRASTGTFAEYVDFANFVELARQGLLGHGARLSKIGYSLTPETEAVEVRAAGHALAFHELLIARTVREGSAADDERENP